jgi:hypothetical protein
MRAGCGHWATPVLSAGFLAVTGAILIWDLEHPERFYYLFTRPQWRSWLVRGGIIIGAYGAVLALHFLASLLDANGLRSALTIAGLPLAAMTAVYTAFLFAQAKARDLWQNPLLPPHLLVQAAMAGAAVLTIAGTIADDPVAEVAATVLAWTAGAHVLMILGEIWLPHGTAHARMATHHMIAGKFALPFWAGVALAVSWRSPPRSRRGRPSRRRSRRLPACGPTSTPTSRPASPSRWPEEARTCRTNCRELNERVSAARADTEARGETFYPGPSRIHLAHFPPKERWDDWVELDSKSWPQRVEKRYMLVPTTCFNCESACGLLAYVDKDTLQVRKFEGNPAAHGSRGRNCAKGPATINQVTDPDRILYPLKRVGERGEGRWERVSWDDVLDELGERIRTAIAEGRNNEVMYHVGRPGEDGFTERVLGTWGVDGHNSHTNVCSSGGRTGYQFWMGIDRPSPDHANAEVIFLISSHLETGHYFNPHAQRIMDAKHNGAKVIVLDVRLSNTATHADHWLAPYPGSEAAICLAIANHLIQTGRYNREFVQRWWNWHEYLTAEHPTVEPTFENFEQALTGVYADYTFEYAAQ